MAHGQPLGVLLVHNAAPLPWNHPMPRTLVARLIQCLSAAVVVSATLSAQLVHDETIHGDLSGSAGSPTVLTFALGANIVSGSMTNLGDVRDFFTFTVPPGSALVALRQVEYTDGGGTFGSVGYHAINNGSTSFTPGFGTASSFLGGNHLYTEDSGYDMLVDLSQALTNGSGFTIPLGPGDYSYIIQQTGNPETFYTLEFELEDDWTELGGALAGVNGDPLLRGSGFLGGGDSNTVTLSNAAASATSGLFVATGSSPVPFKGGLLQPFPFLINPIILPTDASGEISLTFAMPAGVPSGTELWVQWAVQDAAAVVGVALSNAMVGVAP